MHSGKKRMRRVTERMSCQMGTPKGSRSIIATGEVKGMMENQVDRAPEGASIMAGKRIIVSRSGAITGSVNC